MNGIVRDDGANAEVAGEDTSIFVVIIIIIIVIVIVIIIIIVVIVNKVRGRKTSKVQMIPIEKGTGGEMTANNSIPAIMTEDNWNE